MSRHLLAIRALAAVGAKCGGPTDDEMETYVRIAELDADIAVEVSARVDNASGARADAAAALP